MNDSQDPENKSENKSKNILIILYFLIALLGICFIIYLYYLYTKNSERNRKINIKFNNYLPYTYKK